VRRLPEECEKEITDSPAMMQAQVQKRAAKKTVTEENIDCDVSYRLTHKKSGGTASYRKKRVEPGGVRGGENGGNFHSEEVHQKTKQGRRKKTARAGKRS